jgi:glycosyltransferase involved in cell wall biosynthesis
MTIYSGSYCLASGYGRLSASCAKALNAKLISVRDGADMAVVGPCDPVVSPIRLTMWESTELPLTHMAWKQSKLLIVPSVQSKNIFRQYSKIPIEICPLFADVQYAHLPASRPFKFICVARDNGAYTRKGIDELISWFSAAFPTQSDVQLTIKQSPHCKRRYTYDKRINIIYEDYDRAKYHDMLYAHHCGIFLSGAEGWNFPACELMAAGRPSILMPWGGHVDFTTTNTSWHIPYKTIAAPKAIYQAIGKVAYPSKVGTIQAMQEAYSDQLLLAEKAIASARASHEFTEARFAQRLRDIVRKYA